LSASFSELNVISAKFRAVDNDLIFSQYSETIDSIASRRASHLESIRDRKSIDRSLARCKVVRNFREIIIRTGRKNARMTRFIQGWFSVSHPWGNALHFAINARKKRDAKWNLSRRALSRRLFCAILHLHLDVRRIQLIFQLIPCNHVGEHVINYYYLPANEYKPRHFPTWRSAIANYRFFEQKTSVR